jgi:hypothetical protein
MRVGLVFILPALLAVSIDGGPTVPPPRQGAPDTVVLAIQRVGFAVGEVKSRMDLLRLSAGNDPDSAVLGSAARLRDACEALAATAVAQGSVLCSHCLEQERQAPIDAYRAYLPSLERAGKHCAARIVQLRQGAGAANHLRQEATAISHQLVEAIIPYEQRLNAVRVAFGWAPPPTAPVRRGD